MRNRAVREGDNKKGKNEKLAKFGELEQKTVEKESYSVGWL